MEELFAGIVEAVAGVRQDPLLPGVILLLVLSLARTKVKKTLSVFVGKGRYFTVTIKRKHGSLRVVLKGNGSGRWMSLRMSWGKQTLRSTTSQEKSQPFESPLHIP